MLVGYARVSTEDQNLDLQRDALDKAGCERIFEDKANGARDDRPGLVAAQTHLRKGDCLVVWKLDRLGRGLRSLIDFVGELRDRGIDFRTLHGTTQIDTSTAQGRFFFPRHGGTGRDGARPDTRAHKCRAGCGAGTWSQGRPQAQTYPVAGLPRPKTALRSGEHDKERCGEPESEPGDDLSSARPGSRGQIA